MSDQKEYITYKSWKLFSKKGIRNVTMDDIAKKLGISKKTIYRFFKNKSELVEHALEWYFQNLAFSFKSPKISELNAIDQYVEFYKFVTEQISNKSHTLQYDLKKYYPKLWDKFNLKTINRFQSELDGNLQQGVKEGLYRKELNIVFISKTMARLYLSMNQVNDYIFEKEDILNIDYHKELGTYHLYGVCTPKGIEYFKNKLK